MGRSLRRTVRLFVVTAMAAAALTGCSALGISGSTDPGGNDKVEKAHIRVAIIPSLLDIAAYKRATIAGYFREAGLDVEDVTVRSGADTPPMLVHGDIDFAFGNWSTLLGAQDRHVFGKVGGMRVVFDGQVSVEGLTVLAAMPDSGITSIKQLVGKTIGVSALHSIPTMTTQAVLEANGIDPGSVHFEVVPTTSALSALKTHRIAVMSLQEPNLTIAKMRLGVVVVADRATGPVANITTTGYVTTGNFVKDDPKTVRAFQAAMAKGAADLSDRGIVDQTLLSYIDIDMDVAHMVVVGLFPTSITKIRLQRVADLMLTYKLLDHRLDVGPLLVPPQ